MSIEYREAAAAFSQHYIKPLDDRVDEENSFPYHLWREMGKQDFLGVTAPEEFGGLGSTYLTHVVVAEEISRASGSVGLSYIAHSNLCVNQIARNGTQDQKVKFLPKLIRGEFVGALAMSEAGAGSDVMSMKTILQPAPGGYTLSGAKQWITNGNTADVLIVYAKLDNAMTSVIVEKNMEGFSVGRKENKMGMRGSETHAIFFDNCFIPDENVLGQPGKGAKVLMSGLNYERLILAAGPIGLARAALKETVEYTSTREQFGHPLVANQVVAHTLAGLFSRLAAVRDHTYMAAALADQGKLINEIAASAFLEASIAGAEITEQCRLYHGGFGYTLDCRVNRIARDAQLYRTGGGTEEMRREIIARSEIPVYNAARLAPGKS